MSTRGAYGVCPRVEEVSPCGRGRSEPSGCYDGLNYAPVRRVKACLMDVLYHLLFLVIAIGVLVTFHEGGHYLVARFGGVHVVRFCVGFGKPLVSWRDRRGTEFAIAALPLGGYVRMYDRRDPDAAAHVPADPRLAQLSFDRLAPNWRIAIALGGPGANFLLAFLLYWLAAVVGVTTVVPYVGAVAQDGPAYEAGMRGGEQVVAVDGRPTRSWLDVSLALADRLGDTGFIELQTKVPGGTQRHGIAIEDWLRGEDDPNTIEALGIASLRPAVIGDVVDGDPAAHAGLEAMDRIVAVGGTAVASWEQFAAQVAAHPGERIDLAVRRADAEIIVPVTPRARTDAQGAQYGYIGARAGLAKHVVQYGPLPAIGRSLDETWSNTLLTVELLGKMVTLTVSPKNLSGPVTIAVVVGDTARAGLGQFLSLLALLSISLGVLNLLPIPMLDGGQIVLYSMEWARRKPTPARIEALVTRVGLAAVASIMLLAFYNDITRWFL